MWIVTTKMVKNDKIKLINGKAFLNKDDSIIYAKAILNKIASSKNILFDGKGNIKNLKSFLDSDISTFKDEIKGYKQSGKNTEEDIRIDEEAIAEILKIFDVLKSIIFNEKSNVKAIDYENGLLCAKYNKSKLSIYPEDEGMDNGIYFVLKTNLNDEKENKHLYFYVEDGFTEFYECADEDEYKLYIDIINEDE